MAPGIFEQGRYDVLLHRLEAGSEPSVSPPPKPLLIAAPTDAGDFPLLLFLHGYLLYNSFYSHLLKHIASHGFIVVAPQVWMTIILTEFRTFFFLLTLVCMIFLHLIIPVFLQSKLVKTLASHKLSTDTMIWKFDHKWIFISRLYILCFLLYFLLLM